MQRAIPGTNDKLMIDKRGVVTSYRRRQPKVLKHTYTEDSRYPKLKTTINGRSVKLSILQLVAQLFVVNPNPQNYTVAILIDQNPNNICPQNIKWVSKGYLAIKNTRIRDGVKQKYTSEFHGISRSGSGWQVELMRNGERHYIGHFSTQREARNARLQFEAEHPELLDN